ncbi:XrtA-associated tyrosine autokinase [Candidatus Contendibacter odensensis]|uniref:Protein-tyrosine kinase n=1 Tax=Candidatus Contendobacter odensis Run_B_J11 TaxID=1400861 RepID=A0A7U7GEP8_9GAMM|nr:XrtA-associated tyrosine autokinase [Candidatus Contendobacter odensis]CDH46813.1 Protein-tyrosine kinase [Candidatus Contendobacter odensis Run_B_J11]
MDSIEKAMLGRSHAPSAPPVVVPKIEENAIERAIGRAAVAPVAAPVAPKRTQRSVTLNMEWISAAGMLVPDTRRSRIKEEYRHVKRPLLMNIDGKGASTVEHANLIMVTSARPGEGKTFTACNLALSIAAERDRTVLLVDADVVKPSVARVLGFEAALGLVDFLIDDQLDLADVLLDTNVPSLTILPAGSKHHLSTELLASENMLKLATEMSSRYPDRIIIFDSPPLLATTEASVLASLMGQVIMVVSAGRTQQSHVKEALALLNPNQIVGFVLNKARGTLGSDYYSYGYGYGYGSDADTESR